MSTPNAPDTDSESVDASRDATQNTNAAVDGDAEFLSDVDLTRVYRNERIFRTLCFLASIFGLVMLSFLILDILWESLLGWVVGIDPVTFFTETASQTWDKNGILAALIGTLWLMLFTLVFTFFLGVGTAIYLEEYAPDTRITRLIEANLTNLAAVPSVVYGLLVLAAVVNFGGLGPIVISGAMALSLLVVPMIIVSTQEALRAIPDGVRRGSYACGATKWQTIRHVLLPRALPGIFTGTILALARAIGETAPLLMVGAVLSLGRVPGPTDRFASMTTEIYEWALNPVTQFHYVASWAIVVLLAMMFSMMLVAFYLRNKYEDETGLTSV